MYHEKNQHGRMPRDRRRKMEMQTMREKVLGMDWSILALGHVPEGNER